MHKVFRFIKGLEIKENKNKEKKITENNFMTSV